MIGKFNNILNKYILYIIIYIFIILYEVYKNINP